MNTGKQINAMMGLMLVFVVGMFLYVLWDTPRQEAEIEAQTMANSERGAKLFALNCRSCHGITGQGAIERGGLPGAPLNLEANRLDDAGALGALQQRLNDTITCGRIGTAMPQWSQEQGGALNFFQIEQIVTLITGSKPAAAFDPSEDPNAVSEFGWEYVWEEANHADAFSPAVEIAEAVGADDTTIPVTTTESIKDGEILRLGGNHEEPEYELVLVVSVGDGEITVERGAEGTNEFDHPEGTEVFGNFIPPGTGVTGADGVFFCGQTARGGGGGGDAGGDAATVVVDGGVAVSMVDDLFEVEGETNPTLEVGVGESITFDVSNDGVNIHNMRIAGIDDEYLTDDDLVSDPGTIPGGVTGTLSFTIDQPGTFSYQCDFHPTTMLGQISVVE